MDILRHTTHHPLLTSISATLFISGCGGADSAELGTTEQAQFAVVATTAVVGTGTVASCTEAAFSVALAAGGIVTFDCGGPATILITSRKSVANTVTVDGGASITLSGNGQSGLFDVTPLGSLTLKDITLDGASSATDGAAVANHGTLELSGVTVSNSRTSNDGGAIYSDGPLTVVDSCVFTSNRANSGGAIFLDTGVAVGKISNSTFHMNFVFDTGGAIHVGSFAHLAVTDSVFSTNTAAYDGGALFVSADAVVDITGSPVTAPTMSGMQFTDNAARSQGGAIHNQGSHLAITNALFSSNYTTDLYAGQGFGGAIFNSGQLYLFGSVLDGNKARSGGGVFVGEEPGVVGSAIIESTLFQSNFGRTDGGGLGTSAAASLPTVNITRSAFVSNSSKGVGGGLARNDSSLSVESSSFTNNTALTGGGGLFIAQTPANPDLPDVLIQNVTLSGNTAPTGGGVFNSAATVELFSTTIVNNTVGVHTENSGISRFRTTVFQDPLFPNCTYGRTGSTTDDGGNLATDLTCNLLGQSQQGVGLDAQFGPLSLDPNGLTSFLKPLSTSPLIDAAYSCPTLDQIGAPRMGHCDVGAIEGGRRRIAPPIFDIPDVIAP